MVRQRHSLPWPLSHHPHTLSTVLLPDSIGFIVGNILEASTTL